MTDICSVPLIIFVIITIFVIVVILSEQSSNNSPHSGSQEEIKRISSDARSKAQDLSEDFEKDARDLLNLKRR